MTGVIGSEGTLMIGRETFLGSDSPVNSFAAFFEDDGDTGYFYAYDTSLEEDRILDALHIYNASNVTDRDIPSVVQIAWSNDGLKAALIINDYVHAIFDFESQKGYCRTGFPPPIKGWSTEGHEWNEKAIDLFN